MWPGSSILKTYELKGPGVSRWEVGRLEAGLSETICPDLKLLGRGKVRDLYDLGDALVMVATDRISAFDVVMPNPIPGKGRILTQMSRFWFQEMEGMVNHHLISADIEEFPESCQPYADVLKDRSMLVRKAKPLPAECIVRGYVTGSGWKSYLESGTICDIKLPEGLHESDQLPEPLFTPSTKADLGEHDVNISFDQLRDLVGEDMALRLKDLSIALYDKALGMAKTAGIIIADTKFEFDVIDGDLLLIDEILTPDSSRFWPADAYKPGGPQQSFDKQYLRDYLLSLDWDKRPPAPELPPEVVENTRKRYEEALERLTGGR
jgi:phosphoribosylaminoimidazole-succinocarboxamide synthase